MCGGLKKGPWEAVEDERLLQGVSVHGQRCVPTRECQVAHRVPSRYSRAVWEATMGNDSMLTSMVTVNRWTLVATEVGFRSADRKF